MGGVKAIVALSVALAGVILPACAHAAPTGDVRALVREKAAAVEILRANAANEVATLAQGRIFTAYLNATTLGEGLRVKKRIEAALGTLDHRFGLGNLAVIDRGGAVLASIPTISATFDVAKDPALKAGFALAPRKSSWLLGGGKSYLTHVSPVVWRGQHEFVLRAQQDFAAYRKILARDVPSNRFVVLLDDKGEILCDTRGPGSNGRALKLAGLNLDAVRRAVKGTADEGQGDVTSGNERFAVGYQAVGTWTVAVVEPMPTPRRCPKNGARLCG